MRVDKEGSLEDFRIKRIAINLRAFNEDPNRTRTQRSGTRTRTRMGLESHFEYEYAYEYEIHARYGKKLKLMALNIKW